MTGRRYAPHRRAFYPRFWPTGLLAVAVVQVFIWTDRPGVLVTIGVSVALGLSAGSLRWQVWKRRHPVISAEEFWAETSKRMRESARWN